jgi:glycosyltransferase involved in cell wall biosynthesis
VLGEAALLVDPYDVSALADAMIKLLSDANVRAEHIRRGMDQAKRFTWARSAATLLEVYQGAHPT